MLKPIHMNAASLQLQLRVYMIMVWRKEMDKFILENTSVVKITSAGFTRVSCASQHHTLHIFQSILLIYGMFFELKHSLSHHCKAKGMVKTAGFLCCWLYEHKWPTPSQKWAS